MRSFKGRKTLVTGGLGFLGGFVVEELLKRGARVTVTATERRPAHRLLPFIRDIRVMVGDLRDQAFARRALKGQETVFHLAALKVNARFYREHPGEVLRENARITQSFFEAAREMRPRQIVISSSIRAAEPPPMPEGSYGWAKRMEELFAEGYAREFSLPTAIVRLPNTFGPRDNFGENAQVVPSFIRRIAKGEDPFVLQGRRDAMTEFIYVKDAARALVGSADVQEGCETIPVPGQKIGLGELGEAILKAFKVRRKIVFAAKGGKTYRGLRGKDEARFEKELAETVSWYNNILHEL